MILRNATFAICLFATLLGHTQTSLQVLNPLEWGSDKGTIEAAQFTIHPKGIYMEVGMYLTISAREAVLEIDEVDTNLESILNFQLPAGSMVTDSWLWIGEDIIQADVEERWHATRVYNDIVGARKDPSLLIKNNDPWIKNGEDRYQLRVYPLEADSTRRVKLTYLVPGNWQKGKVSIPLPMEILQTSKYPVENVSIQCFLNTDFSNPTIPQLPNHAFIQTTHETLGTHFQLSLSNEEIRRGIDVSLEIPMQQGYFLSNYKDEVKDYYQLAILPQEVLLEGEVPPRKIAILVDYDSTTTTVSKEGLLASLQDQLTKNLRSTDLFNIIFFTADGPQLINTTWLPANAQSIQVVFNLIEEAYHLVEETRLPLLVEEGIKFIQNNGNEGDLLLLSCTEQFHNEVAAKEYISTISDQFLDSSIAIHIVDYQNKNQSSSWYIGEDLWDYHYHGNEYFYTLMNQQFGGYTHILREQKTLDNLLGNSLNALSPVQEIKTIKISNQENNCFNALTLPKPQFGNPNLAVLQVGKCVGNFPLTIEVSGTVNNENITKIITIEEDEAHKGTDNHITSWTGNFILDLEKQKPFYSAVHYHYIHLSQSTIQEIIKRSKAYRILSLYTAFLALEVSQGGYVCETCVDETALDQSIMDSPLSDTNPSINNVDLPLLSFDSQFRDGSTWTLPLGDSIITATEEVWLDTIALISASPNPLRTGTTITISFKEPQELAQASFSIFDINGRRVKSLQPISSAENKKVQFYWDGTDTQLQRLAAGIYFFHVQTLKGQASYKLILIGN